MLFKNYKSRKALMKELEESNRCCLELEKMCEELNEKNFELRDDLIERGILELPEREEGGRLDDLEILFK